jgi:hypothetical protein
MALHSRKYHLAAHPQSCVRWFLACAVMTVLGMCVLVAYRDLLLCPHPQPSPTKVEEGALNHIQLFTSFLLCAPGPLWKVFALRLLDLHSCAGCLPAQG